MRLVVEVSLYPLREKYIAPIQSFIDRINKYQQLIVNTSTTSTTIEGDYQDLMGIIGKEMQITHKEVGQAIFVCKFLNGDKMSNDA